MQTESTVTEPLAVDVSVLVNLFDQVPDVVFFVKDTTGRYTAVNASLVARHGLRDKSEVIGKRSRDICPGDFGGIPSQQDAAVLRTGQPILDHLELHWYEPHKPGWCLTTKLPLRDANGAIVGLIGISRDVRTPIQADDIPVKLAEALNHFETNLGDPITPALLARRAGLPPHGFARFMKRFFGLTPSQFIAKARITAASRLLRETDQSIADIALSCGFYDHSAFTRAFGKVTGTTPSRLRSGSTTATNRDLLNPDGVFKRVGPE
ncbi:MAG: AraC family transcriptional regulator [Planctomycetes bacterium]|nr:AraC family transcriptional regulator [Planctomycetota bacterium]